MTYYTRLINQLGELGRLSASMKKIEKELKNSNKYDVCCEPCLYINSSQVSVFGLFVYSLPYGCRMSNTGPS